MKSEPAFPVTIRHDGTSTLSNYGGLSKREWYAGMAMQGELASYSTTASIKAVREAMTTYGETDTARHIADLSFRIADAMIAASEKENP